VVCPPMSAYGPKRTSLVAPHMSAFGGKADKKLNHAEFSTWCAGRWRTASAGIESYRGWARLTEGDMETSFLLFVAIIVLAVVYIYAVRFGKRRREATEPDAPEHGIDVQARRGSFDDVS
jgi:hypothetical protein